MIKVGHYIALVSMLFIGCKSTKEIKDNEKTAKIKTAKIIKNHYAKKSNFNTLKASLKIKLKTAEKEENFTANVRILKNEKIWVSIGKLGYTGAKILITPTKVQYYNKLESTYFDGDFSLISNWMGTILTFNQLQSVLLGETMFPIKSSLYKSEVLTNGYLLIPEQQQKLVEHYITINPSNFKIKAQEISQPKSYRVLNIEYNRYQEVSTQLFPLLTIISMVEKTTETQVEINYKNIYLNQELRYPFNIPTNYKEISFEK